MDDSLSLRHELSLSEERRSPVGIQQPSNIRLPSLKKDMMKQRDINFVSSDGTSRRMKSLIQKIQVIIQRLHLCTGIKSVAVLVCLSGLELSIFGRYQW